MRCLIVFALLSLGLCQAHNDALDIESPWASKTGLMLTFNQTKNPLNATLMIPCNQNYNVKGNITSNNTFYLHGAVNTTSIAITGQLFRDNVLKITVMKYDYANFTEYTPSKNSFHDLYPILQNTATKTSFDRFNCQANMESLKSFNQEDANCSLDGTWINDLGSTMVVRQTQDGLLEGEYRTAVERKNGSSGGFKTKLYGAISPYSVFSFSLVWKTGASIAVFVGQCIPSVNNSTYLRTQWTLVAAQEFSNTSWKAYFNGKNTFYKEKPFENNWSSEEGLRIQFKGPKDALTAEVFLPHGQQYVVKGVRTRNNTFCLYGATKSSAIGITGLFFRTKKGQVLTITLMKYDYASCIEYTPTKVSFHELRPNEIISYKTEPQTDHNSDDDIAGVWDVQAPNQESSCNLNGTWHNELGSVMSVSHYENGTLEGVYHTAVVVNGSSGGLTAPLHGTISHSTFSFGVVWNKGASITVFIGQCIPSMEEGIVLRAQWSLVINRKLIDNSWDAFRSGINEFHNGERC